MHKQYFLDDALLSLSCVQMVDTCLFKGVLPAPEEKNAAEGVLGNQWGVWMKAMEPVLMFCSGVI